MSPNKTEVLEKIYIAFNNVVLGDGIGLHQGLAYDDLLFGEELQEAIEKDIYNSWQDIPATIIERSHDALAHLDSKGIRFVLPAFMVWAFLNYAALDETQYFDDIAAQESITTFWHKFSY